MDGVLVTKNDSVVPGHKPLRQVLLLALYCGASVNNWAESTVVSTDPSLVNLQMHYQVVDNTAVTQHWLFTGDDYSEQQTQLAFDHLASLPGLRPLGSGPMLQSVLGGNINSSVIQLELNEQHLITSGMSHHGCNSSMGVIALKRSPCLLEADAQTLSKQFYLNDQYDLSTWLKLSLGVRYEDFQKTSVASPQGALILKTSPQGNLQLRYGESHVQGSRQQLTGGLFNTDSKTSMGVSWQHQWQAVRTTVTFFRNQMQNYMVQSSQDESLANFPNASISGELETGGEQKNKGVEIELLANWQWGGQLKFNYSRTVGLDNPELSSDAASWTFAYQYQDLSLSWNGVWNARKGMEIKNQPDDFLLFNLAVQYLITPDLKVGAAILNALDQKPEIESGYLQNDPAANKGRQLSAGLIYQF